MSWAENNNKKKNDYREGAYRIVCLRLMHHGKRFDQFSRLASTYHVLTGIMAAAVATTSNHVKFMNKNLSMLPYKPFCSISIQIYAFGSYLER